MRARINPWFRPGPEETAFTETDYMRQQLLAALAQEVEYALAPSGTAKPPLPSLSFKQQLTLDRRMRSALLRAPKTIEHDLHLAWGGEFLHWRR